jgi:hypothetical protein
MNRETSTSSISTYSQLKNDLLSCTDELLGIEAIRECPCEELREKIRQNTFNLVVVGQFSAARRA